MKNKFFTLIEMIVAIVVIAILAAIILINITGIKERAKDAALAANIKNIELAVELYKLNNNGSLPTVDGKKPEEEGKPVEIDFDKLDDYIKGEAPDQDTYEFTIDENGVVSGKEIPKVPNEGIGGEDSTIVEWTEDDLEEIMEDISNLDDTTMSGIGEEDLDLVNDGVKTDAGSDFLYVVYPKHVVIVGYIGNKTNITIPSTIEGKPVSSVGVAGLANFNGVNLLTLDLPDVPLAKRGSKTVLEEVVIPEGVVYVSAFSFIGNGITKVSLPKSLRIIGPGSFMENDLTEITIPENVTHIHQFAFGLQGSSMMFMEEAEDLEVDYLNEDFTLSKVTLNNKVQFIGGMAFVGNSMTELVIPSTVETLETYAFSFGTIERVLIEEGALARGYYSMAYNNISQATVPSTFVGQQTFYSNHPDLFYNIVNNSIYDKSDIIGGILPYE